MDSETRSTQAAPRNAAEPAEAYLAWLTQLIQASPTSYHAVAEAARQLDAAGFTQLDEREPWGAKLSAAPNGDCAQGWYVLRGGAIVAWIEPAAANAHTPTRIVGCHTDSPGFTLKPAPATASDGWRQVGVEIYGGPLLHTWFDRDLALAGRVVTQDGVSHLTQTGALLRIPSLAIHLQREPNVPIDRQHHTRPLFASVLGGAGDAAWNEPGGIAAGSPAPDQPDPLREHLAERAGVALADIAGWDIHLIDAAEPRRIGLSGELLAAKRLDNLSSFGAGLHALQAAAHRGAVSGNRAMLAAFDHEEIGSETHTGAAGTLLADVLARIAEAHEATPAQQAQARAASWCISADAGHLVHPNYAEKHDPQHNPLPGAGPLLKHNANHRYATDAAGAALWVSLCRRAGVGVQHFVSHNAVPCGSTIGPILAARHGIPTVDAGVGLLSMHSARELAHVADLAAMERILATFFA